MDSRRKHPFNSLNIVNEEVGRKANQNEKIIHLLEEPYFLWFNTSQRSKSFIELMEYFLKVIQQTIEKGYH